jgi:hypothetical protein
MMVIATNAKGKKAPVENANGRFEKMLEAPCPNHHYPAKHAYKNCGLLKKIELERTIRETS